MDPDLLQLFPLLLQDGGVKKSEATSIYNCIAWAANVNTKFWWPDKNRLCFWPVGVPREETLDAFIKAYETLGYVICNDESLEPGYEKVAIYVDITTQKPTHAARQLASGKWTSKLGQDIDVEHDTPSGVSGSQYGYPMQYMRRSVLPGTEKKHRRKR
jgi:hypothetical protein